MTKLDDIMDIRVNKNVSKIRVLLVLHNGNTSAELKVEPGRKQSRVWALNSIKDLPIAEVKSCLATLGKATRAEIIACANSILVALEDPHFAEIKRWTENAFKPDFDDYIKDHIDETIS